MVFPTSDTAMLNFACLKNDLNDYLFSVPDRKILETLIVKRKFYQSLKDNKIPHPYTVYPDLNTKNFDENLSFPVFVKPSISPIFFNKFGKKGFVARSRKDLTQILKMVQKQKIDVIIQQIIVGPPSNHVAIEGFFDRKGKPKILFVRRLLRQPGPFENGSAGISIPLNDVNSMKEILVKYLTAIGYMGIFNATFKKDSRDNTNRLLEINARSFWYNSFASACGANIILTAYLEAIGNEVERITKYRSGIYNIWLKYDLKSLRKMFFNGTLEIQPFLTSYLGKTHWLSFSKDDPKPFLMDFITQIVN